MKIGVIGLGLIGGSVAKAARKAGWVVFAEDSNDDTIRQAETHHVIEPVRGWRRWLDQVDAVVLAVPLDQVEPWIRTVIREVRKPLMLVEVSSVKQPLMATLSGVPAEVTPLSLHPMAGREVRGYSHSQADLFSGHPCAVVSIPGRNLPDQSVIREWMAMLGATPVSVDGAVHDRVVGLVSHVPYLVSASLLTLADQAGDVANIWPQLAGSGFSDTTRVGASNFDLWRQILSANFPEIVNLFRQYARLIDDWVQILETGQWPGELQNTMAVRQRFQPKEPK